MVLIIAWHAPCCHGASIPICRDRLECRILQWRNSTLLFSIISSSSRRVSCTELAFNIHLRNKCLSIFKDPLWSNLPNDPPRITITILQMTKLHKVTHLVSRLWPRFFSSWCYYHLRIIHIANNHFWKWDISKCLPLTEAIKIFHNLCHQSMPKLVTCPKK